MSVVISGQYGLMEFDGAKSGFGDRFGDSFCLLRVIEPVLLKDEGMDAKPGIGHRVLRNSGIFYTCFRKDAGSFPALSIST